MTGRTVGILGLGRMGEAIAEAALLNADQAQVHVTPRNAVRVADLSRADTRITVAEPADIVAACDYIVIALGTDVARDLLPRLNFAPRHHIVSVMAEIGHNDLASLASGAGSVSRVLTLPSVAGGGQLLPCFRVNEAARYLFADRNEMYEIDSEAELMAVWSITGMISATMIVGDVAARWLEKGGIDPGFAQAYARTLFTEAHGVTQHGFAAGMEHVSTPNGLNTMIHARLQSAGVETQFQDSLDVIHQRLIKNTDT